MLAFAGSIALNHHVPPVAVAESHPTASDRDGSRAGAAAPRGNAPGPPGPAGTGTPDPLDTTAERPVPALADPYALTGPSPAFDANVLDAERDLDAVLARMNASRAQAEMARMAAPTMPDGPPAAVPDRAADDTGPADPGDGAP
ncbi:hypothetical protein [Frigidibacter sp. ROC022]|uniref:hypothetical protein n=1 Tax=Frigidibacter sp. ROC022 TaxID=2971796 RepID=UPI00215AFF80|nr:hypothetical protein [Frigidibacter sp. ROC022]MCR8723214.1 hypothetical protein [Frigidibacter sp. ROC022]